jgi:hypothetical protein
MITFRVAREAHGWAVRMGERMTTPFRSRDRAIREAICLARDIRCHGECVEVIVEEAEPGARRAVPRARNPLGFIALPRGPWGGV